MERRRSLKRNARMGVSIYFPFSSSLSSILSTILLIHCGNLITVQALSVSSSLSCFIFKFCRSSSLSLSGRAEEIHTSRTHNTFSFSKIPLCDNQIAIQNETQTPILNEPNNTHTMRELRIALPRAATVELPYRGLKRLSRDWCPTRAATTP